MNSDTPAVSRPRVFYVSYDGAGEPLGRSQVLTYLFRLSADYDITLFSFEKPGADRAALGEELRERGITWHPLSYHKRPPVISTLLDVLAGMLALTAAVRARGRPRVVHVRSYVPALIALGVGRITRAKLLFDIRGFWVDERVEGGIWPQDVMLTRLLYRLAKHFEQRFFREADAVVTLTEASLAQIHEWTAGRELPVVVIPTCVDVDRFAATTPRPAGPQVTWCGSIGTWYRFDLAPALAGALGMGLEVITRQTGLARAVLGDRQALVASLAPSAVPAALHAGDVGLVLCVESFSKIASAPTRFAEYLAAGMPVIVTPGVGDMEEIVTEHRVGTVLQGESAEAFAQAAAAIRALLDDESCAQRCRALARGLFDVDRGSAQYGALYQRLLTS